ncbi:DUF6443 domain-containing protein [uncultured Hymenobacter sp.]|uniref:DUF6443 domain-containing protein n=1 Tax=uncultured Hymenobacter sp. TaxID=170016 RepID=UPI0035CC6B1E
MADGATISQTQTTNSSTAAISWSVPGTYTVEASAFCSADSYASKTVTVVAPPTYQPITIAGSAAQKTSTSAVICAGGYLDLTPPSGSSNWSWTGNGINRTTNGTVITSTDGRGTIRVIPTDPSNVYTVVYKPGTSPCLATSTFTIKVAPSPEERLTIQNTSRFGPGSLPLAVTNPNPVYAYAWYETATSATSATPIPNAGATFTTPFLSQSRSYYIERATCVDPTGRFVVSVVIKRVRVVVAGAVPTAPVRLAYGAGSPSVTLQAETNPVSSGPFTWLLNGSPLAGEAGSQLRATQAGKYTVRVPGTGSDYESEPVEVVDPLAGQTTNGQLLTYSIDVKVLKPNVTDPARVKELAPTERMQTVTYANGFAQPMQQVAVQAGPDQQDIVQPFGFTGTATTFQSLMPFPVTTLVKPAGLYEADPLTKLDAYYSSKGGLPYSLTTTESSPLGRPVDQAQPGRPWAGHTSNISYQANGAQEVRQWKGYNGNQWYGEGQLIKQVQLDPDNRRTEIFKDQLNRVVLQRKVTGTGTSRKTFDTYNVYADAGYLQLVIPPAAVEALGYANQWDIEALSTTNPTFKKQWLYQYTYDNRGRLIERQFPGADPVFLVYDKFDRAILVQDGNHRAANKWLFTKFDAQNRPVVEGLYSQTIGRADLQAQADGTSLSAEFESRLNGGYTTTSTFPSVQDGSTGTVLSVTFYDDYDLNADGQPDYA